MEFAEIKNKSEKELKELLKEQEAKLHGVRLKERTRTLKQVHEVRATKKTIARIRFALASKQSSTEVK